MILIASNALLTGIQVEMAASENKYMDEVMVFKYIQFAYTCVFFLELAIRVGAKGRNFFMSNPSWTWDFLDVFIVGISLIEVAMQTVLDAESSQHVSSTRIIRIARLLLRASRAMRVLRLTKAFSSFRIMLTSVLCSLKSLFWVVAMMLFLMYLFAILFTSATTDFLVTNKSSTNHRTEWEHKLHLHYGSILRSLFTLYKSITGGFNWEITTELLIKMDPVWIVIFMLFHLFFVFAFMNVVTGVCCHSAMESAQQDYRNVIANHLDSAERCAEHFKQLFSLIDSDSSGKITIGEMEHHLQNPAVRAYFQSLDIDASDTWTLFMLLDEDGTHEIDIHEFVIGCLRLKNHVTVADLTKISHESKWIAKATHRVVQDVRQLNASITDISRQLNAMTKILPHELSYPPLELLQRL